MPKIARSKYVIFFVFQENGPISTEWSRAKPFESIPGLGQLTVLTRFLPGGTYILPVVTHYFQQFA